MKMNYKVQHYKGIPIQLIKRGDYNSMAAKRYVILVSEIGKGFLGNQNVWIPNKHLEEDGTIKLGEDITYVFAKAKRQLELAGWELAFQPIRRQEV